MELLWPGLASHRGPWNLRKCTESDGVCLGLCELAQALPLFEEPCLPLRGSREAGGESVQTGPLHEAWTLFCQGSSLFPGGRNTIRLKESQKIGVPSSRPLLAVPHPFTHPDLCPQTSLLVVGLSWLLFYLFLVLEGVIPGRTGEP